MQLRMSTAITVVSMAILLPLCTIAGVILGHKITLKSQQSNEQQLNNRRL